MNSLVRPSRVLDKILEAAFVFGRVRGLVEVALLQHRCKSFHLNLNIIFACLPIAALQFGSNTLIMFPSSIVPGLLRTVSAKPLGKKHIPGLYWREELFSSAKVFKPCLLKHLRAPARKPKRCHYKGISMLQGFASNVAKNMPVSAPVCQPPQTYDFGDVFRPTLGTSDTIQTTHAKRNNGGP